MNFALEKMKIGSLFFHADFFFFTIYTIMYKKIYKFINFIKIVPLMNLSMCKIVNHLQYAPRFLCHDLGIMWKRLNFGNSQFNL